MAGKGKVWGFGAGLTGLLVGFSWAWGFAGLRLIVGVLLALWGCQWVFGGLRQGWGVKGG